MGITTPKGRITKTDHDKEKELTDSESEEEDGDISDDERLLSSQKDTIKETNKQRETSDEVEQIPSESDNNTLTPKKRGRPNKGKTDKTDKQIKTSLPSLTEYPLVNTNLKKRGNNTTNKK